MFYQLDDLSGDITQNKSMVTCVNSQTLQSTYVESVNLTDEFNLENVLCIPDLQHNLISVRVLTKSRHRVIFENNGMVNINDVDNNSTTKIDMRSAISFIYQWTKLIWQMRIEH